MFEEDNFEQDYSEDSDHYIDDEIEEINRFKYNDFSLDEKHLTTEKLIRTINELTSNLQKCNIELQKRFLENKNDAKFYKNRLGRIKKEKVKLDDGTTPKKSFRIFKTS